MIDLTIKMHLTFVDDEEHYGEHVVYDIIDPQTGYLVERYYTLMEAVTFAAVPKCQIIHYGYPHPGCADFGPPDEIPCGEDASHRVVFKDEWDPDLGVVLLCDDHAAEMSDNAADPRNGLEIIDDGPLPVRDLGDEEDYDEPDDYDDGLADALNREAEEQMLGRPLFPNEY